MFPVFRVPGEFRNLLVSTVCRLSPHYFSCPLALLVLPSQCPRLPVLIMHGTVQSDCFGSLRVLPRDLLFVLTLDVMSVLVLVAFYWFLVRFSDSSCACLLIRLWFSRVIPLFPAIGLSAFGSQPRLWSCDQKILPMIALRQVMIKTVTLRILGIKQRNLIEFMCKTSCSAFPQLNNLLFSWLNVVFMARFKAKSVAGCGLKSIKCRAILPHAATVGWWRYSELQVWLVETKAPCVSALCVWRERWNIWGRERKSGSFKEKNFL